jgi:hypothetical protein
MVRRALAFVVPFVLGGCSLYFGEPDKTGPTPPPMGDDEPQPDAGGVEKTCPKAGTHAEILYPANGATNVAVPVPIKLHVYIPNTLDGKGAWLTDANGQLVDLDHWVMSCSVPIPPIQTGPVQDLTWTACYDLPPNAEFTWHIMITCYDPSGPQEITTATFRTAP